jgi:hypothetical protein
MMSAPAPSTEGFVPVSGGRVLVRPGSKSRGRRAHAALVVLPLAVLPLAVVGGLVLWQLRPSGEAAAPLALVAPSRLQLQQAQAAVSFPLQLPDAIDAIDDWFPLTRVQVTGDGAEQAWVLLWYSGNGGYLRIVQGPRVAPEPTALADWPAAEQGMTAVQGGPATWRRGTLVPTAAGPRVWRPGPLQLYWTTAAGTGYLLESDFYDLDQLVQLAQTVAPCAPATAAGRERPFVGPHRPLC